MHMAFKKNQTSSVNNLTVSHITSLNFQCSSFFLKHSAHSSYTVVILNLLCKHTFHSRLGLK